VVVGGRAGSNGRLTSESLGSKAANEVCVEFGFIVVVLLLADGDWSARACSVVASAASGFRVTDDVRRDH